MGFDDHDTIVAVVKKRRFHFEGSGMSKTCRSWNPDQAYLLQPSPLDWLPEELSRRKDRLKKIREARKALETTAKAAAQEERKRRGQEGRKVWDRLCINHPKGRPVEWVHAFILGYLGRRNDTLYTIPIMNNRCILPDGAEVMA